MKLGHARADENLQIGNAHTPINIWCTWACAPACVLLIELWCGARGWVDALVSSPLPGRQFPVHHCWHASPMAIAPLPSSLCVASLSFSLPLLLFLSLSLYPFLSCGCDCSHSVQMNIGTGDNSSSSRERCKEPRGAPMAPHSHLLSLSPSITSHTPTPNLFLFLSPCPCPSPHAGHQNTRTRQSGGRRCPVTTSQRGLWTCMHGPHRMRVRSHCLKTGKWPTQRLAWSIS